MAEGKLTPTFYNAINGNLLEDNENIVEQVNDLKITLTKWIGLTSVKCIDREGSNLDTKDRYKSIILKFRVEFDEKGNIVKAEVLSDGEND